MNVDGPKRSSLSESMEWALRASNGGLVAIQTAELDYLLECALKTKMRRTSDKFEKRLFDGYGPLSSFAAKIDMAYALDIIATEIYEEINKIRRIRNEFSHTREVLGFDDKRI